MYCHIYQKSQTQPFPIIFLKVESQVRNDPLWLISPHKCLSQKKMYRSVHSFVFMHVCLTVHSYAIFLSFPVWSDVARGPWRSMRQSQWTYLLECIFFSSLGTFWIGSEWCVKLSREIASQNLSHGN